MRPGLRMVAGFPRLVSGCLIVVALSTSVAFAEVKAASAHGFLSVHTLTIAATQQRVYEALTRDVHRWWDATHSYSGDAAAFSLEASANGCFCERLAHGGVVVHMTVVHAAPGELLRLHGGLGPLQAMGVSGAMDFELVAVEEGTELRYRYEVGGFHHAGLDGLAPAVDQVQLGQLLRLKRFVENGTP